MEDESYIQYWYHRSLSEKLIAPDYDMKPIVDLMDWAIDKLKGKRYNVCPGCNGSGVEHNPDYPPCSICNGDGVILKKGEHDDN